MRIQMVGLIALGFLISTSVVAKSAPEWKEQSNAYKAKNALPVKAIALSAVNVDVGVHLERLTLLSGEGHTGKKLLSGLLAGAATVSGVGGGMDFASREPLEEHLTPEESRKIADDVAKMVIEHFRKMEGYTILAGEEVTSKPFYSGLSGLNDIDTGKKRVQDGRWSPEYYFGYYSTPAGSYKYRKMSKFAFSDKEFSPVVRQNLSADATLQVNVFLVNTRGDFRIQEMSISLSGQQWASQKGDMVGLNYILNNPNEVSVPMDSKSKDNYAAWTSLKPKVDILLDEIVLKMKAALPPLPAAAAPVMAAAPVVKEALVADTSVIEGQAPAPEKTAVADTLEDPPAVEEVPATHK